MSWREVEYCPSRPAKGEVLTPKVSRSVGSSIAIVGRASGASGLARVAPMLASGEAGQGDDLAGARRGDLDPLQPVEDGERVNPLPRLLAVRRRAAPGCRRRGWCPAARGRWRSAPGGGRSRARRPASAPVPRVDVRRRHLAHDRLEERAQVGRELGRIGLGAGAPLAGDGVEDRELELLGVGGQLQEEILQVSSIDLVDAGCRAVDLVDDDDRAQPALQRPLQDGARLRHRALDGVDQQQAAVGHVQHALDLAAEVGVAGGVDDVDLHARVGDGRVLGEDGDAALALQIVGVDDQAARGVGVAEDVRLLEQAVDEGRLAVVDVGDDGDVAQVRGI